jgi:prophage maintenance system killer protein
MYITIPTDGFDNPKPENTAVEFKEQFLNTITNQTIKTKDLIAWKNINAPTQSGLVLVSAACDKTITKEFDAVIYPGIATDFTISFSRNHEFADGNQITTMKTSIIKDKFGNVVSDGTLVSFAITNQEKNLLKSFGTTIDGVATTQILHPDHQEIFTVKAFVTGIAESNSLTIDYQPINPKIEYNFSNNNRTLTVGPLRSFMNQLVPDGCKVSLKIYHNNKLVDTLFEDTSKGKVIFTIAADFYKEKNYWFEISTLGSSQKTTVKKYDVYQ